MTMIKIPYPALLLPEPIQFRIAIFMDPDFEPEEGLPNNPFETVLHFTVDKLEIGVNIILDNLADGHKMRILVIAVQGIAKKCHHDDTDQQASTYHENPLKLSTLIPHHDHQQDHDNEKGKHEQ